MSETRTHLADVPIGGVAGFVWNRLHAEREDICEAMLKNPQTGFQSSVDLTLANARRRLLEARLREIDDALDRLMTGH